MDTERPLRLDAERNRDAILSAATAAFAAHGSAASLDDIARSAKVGVATLYRRFPTRELLVQAVFDQKVRAYADAMDAAAERARTEPWLAFHDQVMVILEQQATDIAFAEILAAPLTGSDQFRAEHRRAFRSMLTLIERAKAAGAVRADFHHSDIYLLTLATAGITRVTATIAPGAWRRHAAYMLESFRAPGSDAGALPAVSASWRRLTERQ